MSNTSTKSTTIQELEWPNNLPPEGDSFYSVYCDDQDLHWVFYKPDGSSMQWRTPHMQHEVSDDKLIEELIYHFPDDSEPLKYIFGPSNKNNTFQGALKQSKFRKSNELYVYFLDDTIEVETIDEADGGGDKKLSEQVKVQKERNERYANQIDIIHKLWSAIPCKAYKVNSNHFIQSSKVLSEHKDQLKKLTPQMVAAYFIANIHYTQPFLILHESKYGTLGYIGSWEKQDKEDKIIMSTGNIPKPSSEEDYLEEINKVISNWRHNLLNPEKDFSPTILLGADRNHDLEARLMRLLQEEKNAELKKSYEFCHILTPIPHGVDQLVIHGREKAEREARRRKLQEAEEARKRHLEAKRKKKEENELKKKKAEEERKKKEKKRQEELKKKRELEKKKREEAKKQKEASKAQSPRRSGKRKLREREDHSFDDPTSLIDVQVAKTFDDGIAYFGTVQSYHKYVEGEDEPMWNVLYEDGDTEDINQAQLSEAIEFYEDIQQGRKRVKTYQNM